MVVEGVSLGCFQDLRYESSIYPDIVCTPVDMFTEDSLGCLFSVLHVEARAQLNLELTDCTKLAGLASSQDCLPFPQYCDTRHMQWHPASYVGSGDPNSGLCALYFTKQAISLPLPPTPTSLKTARLAGLELTS